MKSTCLSFLASLGILFVVTLLGAPVPARAELLSDYLARMVKKVKDDSRSREIGLDDLRARLEASKASGENCQVFRAETFATPALANLGTVDGYEGKILVTKILSEERSSVEGEVLLFRNGLPRILEHGDQTIVAYDLHAAQPRFGNWDPRNLFLGRTERIQVLEFNRGALVWAGAEISGEPRVYFRCGTPQW